MNKKASSSWESSHDWYSQSVGAKGHYYHEHVVMPGLLRMLKLGKTSELLDVACGQGVLSRNISSIKRYVGLDISKSLIAEAKSYKTTNPCQFLVHDAMQPFPESIGEFTHSAIVLALQNMPDAAVVLTHIHKHLKKGATLVIVLNHPAFRIPRQSGWHIDESKKLQSRRIDRYMSSLEIPIDTHPSQKDNSPKTLTFHRPISYYFSLLQKSGFVATDLEEWCSDKKSTGKMAAMEDRARKEFPLFLAIAAKKTPF